MSSSLNRITKFFWIISLLAFLALNLYAYAQLPQTVGYIYNADGLPVELVSRPVFFFVGTAFVIVLNLIFIALIKTFLGLPFKQLGWSKFAVWHESRSAKLEFTEFIETWGYSFIVFLNLSLINTLYVLWKVNVEIGSRISDYSWFIWPFLFLILIFPVYLVARLTTLKPSN